VASLRAAFICVICAICGRERGRACEPHSSASSAPSVEEKGGEPASRIHLRRLRHLWKRKGASLRAAFICVICAICGRERGRACEPHSSASSAPSAEEKGGEPASRIHLRHLRHLWKKTSANLRAARSICVICGRERGRACEPHSSASSAPSVEEKGGEPASHIHLRHLRHLWKRKGASLRAAFICVICAICGRERGRACEPHSSASSAPSVEKDLGKPASRAFHLCHLRHLRKRPGELASRTAEKPSADYFRTLWQRRSTSKHPRTRTSTS